MLVIESYGDNRFTNTINTHDRILFSNAIDLKPDILKYISFRIVSENTVDFPVFSREFSGIKNIVIFKIVHM